MKISATIITCDEEATSRAIESLRCCDEILVLDSGSWTAPSRSPPNSAPASSTLPAGLRQTEEPGAEKASHDWILSLDATRR